MKPNLPPLPKLPGTENYVPLGDSIIDVLGAEHRFLEAACADVRDGRYPADILVAVLCRHLSAERQYLYPTAPASRPTGDDELLRAAGDLLHASTGTPTWQSALAAVSSGVHEHASHCETAYFAPMRAELSRSDLVRLGNRVEMALESAPSRPHLTAPTQPPWNKLTDPGLGALDKIHDLFTGRRTYPPPAPEAARKRLRTRSFPITQS